MGCTEFEMHQKKIQLRAQSYPSAHELSAYDGRIGSCQQPQGCDELQEEKHVPRSGGFLLQGGSSDRRTTLPRAAVA